MARRSEDSGPRRPHRWLRRLLLAALALVVLLVLLVVALQTPYAKRRLARFIENNVSTAIVDKIEIGKITGTVPFNFQIEKVTLWDEGEPWLIAHEVAVDVARGPLFQRRVHVRSASSELIELLALPVREEREDPWQLPRLPDLPRWLRIDRAVVDELRVSDAVAAEAGQFTATAQFIPDPAANDVKVEAHIERLDAATTYADLVVQLAEKSLTLRADASDSVYLPDLLNVEETVILRIEGSGPLNEWNGTLEAGLGDATLAQASATLRGEAGTAFESSGTMNLVSELVPEKLREQIGGRVQFAVSGAVEEDGLLRLQSARVASERATATATGRTHLEEHTLSGEVTLRHDNLRAFVALAGEQPLPVEVRTHIEGTRTQQNWTLDATLAGEPLAALEGMSTVDTLLKLAATGELAVPRGLVADEYDELADEPIALSINATYDQSTGALSVPEFNVGNPWASLAAAVNAIPAENLIDARAELQLADSTLLNEVLAPEIAGTGTATLRIEGTSAGTAAFLQADFSDVRVEQLEVPRLTAQADLQGGPWPDNLLAGLSGEVQASTGAIFVEDRELPPLRLAVVAEQESGGLVQIRTLRLTDDRFVLAGGGTVAEDGRSAELSVELDVPDLAPYMELVDQPYDGAVDAQLTATYDAERDVAWQGRVNAAARELAGLPSLAADLLTPAATLAANFAYDGDQLSIPTLQVGSTNWQLNGEGTYAFADQSFDARGRLELNELRAANLQATGSFGLTAAGTPEQFQADTDVQLTNVTSGEMAVDSLSGAVLAAGSIDDLRVTTQLTARTAGEELHADAVVQYAGSTVQVPELTVRSGANVIDGEVVWNLDTQQGQGNLALDVPELEQIGRVLGQELQGQLSGNLALDPAQAEQTLTVDLSIENFDAPFASLDEADIDGTVRDLFGEPAGSINAEIESLLAGTTEAHFTTITAEFQGNQVEVDATSAGLVQDTIPFEANAQAAWSIEESIGELSALNGSLEDYTFALQSPARLRFTEQGMVLESTTLAFGDGTIQADARLADDALKIDAEWISVPLAAGRLVGLPFSQGTLAGSLTLRGSPDRPIGEATVDISNARTPIMEETGEYAANIHVESELTGQALALTATLQVPRNADAELALSLPLAPAEGTVFAIDEDGAWSGQLTSNVDLAMIPRLLALDRHVLEGRAVADLTLAGSPANPSLDGNVNVASATYENAEFGTILRDIQIEIDATNDRIELVELRATDPAGGSLQAQGQVEFADLTTFEHRFTANLNDARLVHRDDLSGRLEGQLVFSGNQDTSELAGDLDVVEANVILRPAPDRAIPELEVTAVNVPPSYEAEEEETAPSLFENYPIRLDIEVSMPGRVFVQAHSVFTEWDGTVQVSGTLDDPEFTGQIAPVRGYIAFLGQRFELQRESSIRVDTREAPAPVLSLVAKTTRDDVEATLFLRGPLSELSLEMTSEPPLPREEILARVLFGKNMSEISPVQALQLARAVAMFSGTLEGVPFFSGPSRLPVIDTFDVETGEEGGPTVSVGKYLSEDIFVELEQGAGPQTGRASVEFEVTPNISVESTVGADTEGGLGVFWKYDY